MEDKHEPKSELEWKLMQIPIEEFEKDDNTESMKDKKEEILDLFTNYSKNFSEAELKENEQVLREACRNYDVELIKIYLSETIENESNTLSFKINRTNKTASLFKVNSEFVELVIQRTVLHESTEYLITSITGTISHILTIKFVEDSAVETFYGYSLQDSDVEEIYFPSSLKVLKDKWCCSTEQLKKIVISPSNGQFKVIDNKFLFGKSDSNKDEFDVLLFACRDIEEISIPSNIKIISSFAFEYCQNLTKVEIPQNSNLQTIESYAFYATKINEIYFPANLKELKKGWCYYTSNLAKITISPSNGQFKVIDNKFLVGKSDSNKDEFDVLLFACRDIEEISIPSNIKIISSFAFEYCQNLSKVEIPPNSNLQTIESHAFSWSNIKEIFIPSKVSKIGELAFEYCQNLSKIEFPSNSNLQIIESNAFLYSNIINFFIPSKVSEIGEDAFDYCRNLQIIEFSEESELDLLKISTYVKYPETIIMIPSSLNKKVHSK